MKLSDLITSKSGGISYTKLAACTGHLLMAISFAWLTYNKGFIAELWIIYGGYTIGHAGYEKTINVFRGGQNATKE